MRNRGVVQRSAVRAHGAGVSVSELAQSLWQMTNTKDGEVGPWSCVVWGRGVVTLVVDSGSFKMMHAPGWALGRLGKNGHHDQHAFMELRQSFNFFDLEVSIYL